LYQLVRSRCAADRRKRSKVNLIKEQLQRKLMKEGYNAEVPEDQACATFIVLYVSETGTVGENRRKESSGE
jgi:hypothetical protein